MVKQPLILAIAMATVFGSFPGRSSAQSGIPRCDQLPNPIFARGTTAVVPLVRRLGAKLGTMEPKHTFIYKYDSACNAIEGLTNPYPRATRNLETAEYYVDDGKGKVAPQNCNVWNDHVYDLVISDIFSVSCNRSYNDGFNLMPAGFKEFIGPVQGVVPIVSQRNSYNTDIMSRELENIYVCGGAGKVSGFLSDGFVADYVDGEGMREMMALMFGRRGINLKTGLGSNLPYLAADKTDATAIMEIVANTISPDSTIGYTSTEVYDENRDKVKAMKLRGPRQVKAYLPDTDLNSRDKVNIREGRYMWQGALKLVAHVDATGQPDNPAAKKMIDWLQGNPIADPTLKLPVNIISIYASSGVVPQCTMKVTKTTDEARFKPYVPANPCHCFFRKEATAGLDLEGCVACVDSSTCATGKVCSYGYCE